MVGLDKIEEFKNYVSGFSWNNYQRDYRKPNDLKKLYWSVVFMDYLDSTYHKINDTKYSAFSDRVQKSFMGTYYKPHEIIVKWESRLNGFSKLYIVDNKDYWDVWIEVLRKDFIAHFSILYEIIHRYLIHNIKNQQEDRDFDLKLTEFDSKHKNIKQVVSRILTEHIEHTRYTAHRKLNELPDFPIHIPKEIIDQAHLHAHNYFSARFTYWFLTNFASRLPVDRPFSPIKADSIQSAFENLLQRYPRFKELGRAPLTEMIDLYCQDLNGKNFARASVRTYLKRNGFE